MQSRQQQQKDNYLGTSLVNQWLKLCAPNAGEAAFDAWSGTEMLRVATKSTRAATEDPRQSREGPAYAATKTGATKRIPADTSPKRDIRNGQ